MKLLDIKNNLIKLSYTSDENVSLASFLMLSAGKKSYVGQITTLKAQPVSNHAIAKLILVVNNDGILDNYDGSIPSLDANIVRLDSKELLNLLPVEKPIIFGEVAHEQKVLKLDESVFERHLLICAERLENINLLIDNCVRQLNKQGEKTVIIDTDFTFEDKDVLRFKRDFKMPLNVRMLDFIFEHDMEEADASTKAVVQEILTDVREYAKEVKFIPLKKFLDIVSGIYDQTKIPELALLKSKLVKYLEDGIFAENEDDIAALEDTISKNLLTYIDIADVSDDMQKELLLYIQDKMELTNEYICSFVKVNNKNSDKQLLLRLTSSERVFTSIICSHSYKYVDELKQLAENIILFAPQTAQHDFTNYNTFLSKLNSNEFVVYGNLTQNIPFVAQLFPLDDIKEETSPKNDESIQETPIEPQESQVVEHDDVLNFDNINNSESEDSLLAGFDSELSAELPQEQIIETEPEPDKDKVVDQVAKDVDEVFITNKTEEIQPIEDLLSPQDENLTEADLDFIDELPQNNSEPLEGSLNDVFDIAQSSDNGGNDVLELENETPDDVELSVDESAEPLLDESVDAPLEENSIENENLLGDEGLPEEISIEEPQNDMDLPVFMSEEDSSDAPVINFEQGDEVSHPKYGKGIIEKLIKYGNKTLCSISFEEVGRRLLDPSISELQKL